MFARTFCAAFRQCVLSRIARCPTTICSNGTKGSTRFNSTTSNDNIDLESILNNLNSLGDLTSNQEMLRSRPVKKEKKALRGIGKPPLSKTQEVETGVTESLKFTIRGPKTTRDDEAARQGGEGGVPKEEKEQKPEDIPLKLDVEEEIPVVSPEATVDEHVHQKEEGRKLEEPTGTSEANEVLRDVTFMRQRVEQLKGDLKKEQAKERAAMEKVTSPSVCVPPAHTGVLLREGAVGGPQEFIPDSTTAQDEAETIVADSEPLLRGHVAVCSLVGKVVSEPQLCEEGHDTASYCAFKLRVDVPYYKEIGRLQKLINSSDAETKFPVSQEMCSMEYQVRCFGSVLAAYARNNVKEGFLVHAFGNMLPPVDGGMVLCLFPLGGNLTVLAGEVCRGVQLTENVSS